MELKICMSDKHHRYYKHTKFRQNPRGDPKFLVDLTWNDPKVIQPPLSCHTVQRFIITEHLNLLLFCSETSLIGPPLGPKL